MRPVEKWSGYLGAERVFDAVERGTDLAQALTDRIGSCVVVDVQVDQSSDEQTSHLQTQL